MKRILAIAAALALLMSGCYTTRPIDETRLGISSPAPTFTLKDAEETYILLSDHGCTVEGKSIGSDSTQAVYAANDIVYYEAGHDFTYGEGTAEDEHSAAEAAEHTVVHITQPGTYRLSGSLTPGQIAVDLGEDAKDDPEAVVTLILDGVHIECSVAPAIIFYNVYECGSKDAPTMEADTSAAGANIIMAGMYNSITGSHVPRIYKSYTLSEDGSEVIDSTTLHKYDGALYSRMSMNISAENIADSGTLSIGGDNEGLCSEMHLTIHSGDIWITSGNDGINTNEDGVSVAAIHGGELNIRVTGDTGEGDGIDSNGWIVISGGTVRAMACADSDDSGLDADNGVFIKGGTVISSGNMPDPIEGSQTYAAFSFALPQTNASYLLRNSQGDAVFDSAVYNGFSNLLLSSPELVPGIYTLWRSDTQLGGMVSEGGRGGFEPGERPAPDEGGIIVVPVPEDGIWPAPSDDFHLEPPEHSDGFEGIAPPEGFEDGMELPESDRSGRRDPGGMQQGFVPGELSGDFVIKEGANFFSFVHTLPLN